MSGDSNIQEGQFTGKMEELVISSEEVLVSEVEKPENGFIREKQIDEFTYTAYMKPTEYLLAKEKEKQGNDSLKKSDFEDLQYFDLRIRVEDFNQEFIKYELSDASEYKERINYCAFSMQNDLKLIDGRDTNNCVLFHFERTFNTAPYGHFLLAFEKGRNYKEENAKTIVFHDKLFNNGTLKFSFQPKKIIVKKSLT